MLSFENKKKLTIKVFASGKIIVNEKLEMDWDSLKEELIKLKAQNGTVWYYRENAGGQSNEVAMDVFDFIIKNKLPVSLSSKPDFSDYVDQNGNVFPRKQQ